MNYEQALEAQRIKEMAESKAYDEAYAKELRDAARERTLALEAEEKTVTSDKE